MTARTLEFSDDELLTICETANVIACECPAHLVELLRRTKSFRKYTTECVTQEPEQAEIHNWLDDQVAQVEGLLTEILSEFVRREDLLNEQQELDFGKLSQRSHKAALRQYELMVRARKSATEQPQKIDTTDPLDRQSESNINQHSE